MDLSWFLPLLGFALVTCGTPGPNNMLLTAAGANLGVRASLPMLVVVVTGLNLIMLATACGLGALFEAMPALHLALKLIGSGYLLWLAWQLAMAGEPGERSVNEMPRWWQAASLQLVNPKGWFMAISAIGGFTLAAPLYLWSATTILLTFYMTGLVTGLFWVLFGAQVRRWIRSASGWRCFNRSMGTLTAACILMIWL